MAGTLRVFRSSCRVGILKVVEKGGSRRDSFGVRLRALREAAGLTQEELASMAGLTARGIGMLERGQRSHPYPHTVRSLSDAMKLSDTERMDLLAAVPGRDDRAEPAPASTLPIPPTPLVGREREVGEIGYLLGRSEVRLLTLTGLGGVGKTRIATEVARGAAERFPDGVVFAGLAPLRDAALVVSSVARAFGLGESEGREDLVARLEKRQVLLVLDNFEHVAEAAPEVAGLISACPDLTVLVTSRSPLRLRGEREYPVTPLALPRSTLSPEPEEVLDSPAGRLFAERAQDADPSFGLTPENAPAVAAICWRVDGLPLALELAAARARFLDPGALLSRLDLALSKGWAQDLPERQRTMRSTLDWSHDLLSDDEKTLFEKLSVFAGGFTLKAVEALGEEDALVLGSLVEQSMVVAEPSRTRYGMLEPVRQYALEKLEAAGEADAVRELHSRYFLALVERAGPELRGSDGAAWLARLETELGNLRAAISWALNHGEVEALARIARTSWLFWWLRGHADEGRRWIEETLDRGTDLPDATRARLLFIASTLAHGRSDWERSRAMADESLALFRRIGDDDGIALALGAAGIAALGQGRHEEGLASIERSIELGLAQGQREGPGILSSYAASVPLAGGDLVRAQELAEQGLAIAREIEVGVGVSAALHILAQVALAEGDLDGAMRLFEEGLTVAVELGEDSNVAFYLQGIAAVAVRWGDPIRAVRLWGAAEALLEGGEVISYAHTPDRSVYERQVGEARERLDEASWRWAWAEGRAMTKEAAVAEALTGGE
jgi:predicted ATPase/transcriptional regulator with XRE-family HTH domain